MLQEPPCASEGVHVLPGVVGASCVLPVVVWVMESKEWCEFRGRRFELEATNRKLARRVMIKTAAIIPTVLIRRRGAE